ncbi:tRNA (guanine(46)-N(7))-methyltransferase TrmB [Bartonella sp. CB175]|uniref:tRNA (guanine(46)-N(7))-methyltransferase TrmB n=1 Tax=Bartonella sp. CB175 TaxID=3112256 RepID=UPI00300E3AEB
MTVHNTRMSEAFFGRRKGKRLRKAQHARIKTLLPTFNIDLNNPTPSDLTCLFSSKVKEVRLEIGFGGGEHLLHEMEHYPQTGFIGVEPFINGIAKLLMSIEQHQHYKDHLRLYNDDATRLLDWLPNASLDGIDLFYPDPWPKKKHWKRRFINIKNLNRFARVLKTGKKFRFASDVGSYVNWTLYHCIHHHSFEWEADKPEDWQNSYPLWSGTRYEAKALREGKTPAYLTFIKK